MGQKVCGYRCAAKVPKLERKAERAKDRASKEAQKTRSKWLAEAQTAVNRYVRLRDIHAGYGCITCGARPVGVKFGGAFDCGHYLSRGSSPHLRFNLHNMALQCARENRYLGGVAGKFRMALVDRIGLTKVERLEAQQGPAKFTIDYLRRLKAVFGKKANRLEKRHADLQD